MSHPTLPLAGRRVVITRDEPGRLDELLVELGAEVVHVPLIEIEDADPAELAALGDADWVVVTSQHGARRVGGAIAGRPEVRLAAVGTRTAAVLAARAGRAVDVVPDRQTAADLVAAMPDGHGALAVVAQADRADGALATGLGRRGYRVTPVTAYRTVLRKPTEGERRAALTADAVAFASGSAAEAWAAAIGTDTPPIVVAIGPTTRRVAAAAGLKVTHVAADHNLEGLAAEVAAAFEP